MSLAVGVRRRVRWPVAGLAAVACWVAAVPVLAAFTDTEHNPQDVQAADEIDPPPLDAGIRVQSLRNRSDGANQIVPTVQILNDSDVALDLRAVTLRYWFTVDGASTVISDCYYAVGGCGQLTHRVVVPEPSHAGGDRYLEVGFTAGSVAPGATSGEIRIGLRRDFRP